MSDVEGTGLYKILAIEMHQGEPYFLVKFGNSISSINLTNAGSNAKVINAQKDVKDLAARINSPWVDQESKAKYLSIKRAAEGNQKLQVQMKMNSGGGTDAYKLIGVKYFEGIPQLLLEGSQGFRRVWLNEIENIKNLPD